MYVQYLLPLKILYNNTCNYTDCCFIDNTIGKIFKYSWLGAKAEMQCTTVYNVHVYMHCP